MPEMPEMPDSFRQLFLSWPTLDAAALINLLSCRFLDHHLTRGKNNDPSD